MALKDLEYYYYIYDTLFKIADKLSHCCTYMVNSLTPWRCCCNVKLVTHIRNRYLECLFWKSCQSPWVVWGFEASNVPHRKLLGMKTSKYSWIPSLPFFSKILPRDNAYDRLSVSARYGVSFVSWWSDVYPVIVFVILYIYIYIIWYRWVSARKT